MKIATLSLLLVVREWAMALADPRPHDHTEPLNGRCTLCGHRIETYPGEVVIETRKLPPGDMLREPSRRAKARLAGLLVA